MGKPITPVKGKQENEFSRKQQKKKRPPGKTEEGDKLEYRLVVKKARILMRIRRNVENSKDHNEWDLQKMHRSMETEKRKPRGGMENGNKRQIGEKDRQEEKKKRRIEGKRLGVTNKRGIKNRELNGEDETNEIKRNKQDTRKRMVETRRRKIY